MDDKAIRDLVKATIETQIIKALNEGPELIEKLVKAALNEPVDSAGKKDGWGSKMPFIDYLVGEEIRRASQDAVRRVVKELSPQIEANVRAALGEDSVTKAMAKAIIGTVEQDWKINVKFEKEERN
jgi:hypothetical protein